MQLTPKYNPKDFESKIYKQWLDSKIGQPESQIKAQNLDGISNTHSILMPPPNLTGNLHAGHAFQHFVMDTLSRVARQKGELNLWFPGVDHAGLQLEGVIDKLIRKGEFDDLLESYDFGDVQKEDLPKYLKKNNPDLWLKMAWQKVNEWRDNQKNQSAVLGDTPDYDRSLFTLDSQNVEMVNYAYQKYWKDGLIYKGSYLINWSVGLQTALSDVAGEIEYEKRIDPFVTFEYRLFKKADQGFEDLSNAILVSTVRPETIFGDYAVAVHPDIFASRYSTYQSYLDKENLYVQIPLTDKKIPVILATEVDPDFGSGALKITPAHDIVDYDIFNKYLGGDFEQAIGRDGKLTNICGKYIGMKVNEGRLAIIKDMVEQGYVPQKTDNKSERKESKAYFGIEFSDATNPEDYQIDWNYEHNVTICERSKTVVEPIISEEFFVAWNKEFDWNPTDKTANQTLAKKGQNTTLANLGVQAVKETNFYTTDYKDRGINFLENIKDWCISRDLIWGHKMPVWYNLDTNPDRRFWSYKEMNGQTQNDQFAISPTRPTSDGNWVQEEKILDTWFSSCLWPLSTLNYKKFVDNLTQKPNLVMVHGGISEDKSYQNWLESSSSNTYWFGSAPAGDGKSWKSTIKQYCQESNIDTLKPSMPSSTKANYEDWKTVFEKMLPHINSNSVLVGHSLGGIFLTRYLSEKHLDYKAVFLVASGLWEGQDSFATPADLSNLDNQKTYIIHSHDDSVVSFEQAKKLADKLPNANFIEKSDLDHMMGSCQELEQAIIELLPAQPKTDFETFYPTSQMITGKDIFYQWIVRMTTLCYYFTSQIPYRDLVVTPTVLDEKGKKMSKSLGNGLDPVAQIDKYSSDALRMAMLSGMIPDRNMKMGGRLADELCEKYRNFGNKMWNIARFFEYQESQQGSREK